MGCGLSQEELGYLVGLHRTYVGSVERGEPKLSIDNIDLLAQGVKTSLPDLLTP